MAGHRHHQARRDPGREAKWLGDNWGGGTSTHEDEERDRHSGTNSAASVGGEMARRDVGAFLPLPAGGFGGIAAGWDG